MSLFHFGGSLSYCWLPGYCFSFRDLDVIIPLFSGWFVPSPLRILWSPHLQSRSPLLIVLQILPLFVTFNSMMWTCKPLWDGAAGCDEYLESECAAPLVWVTCSHDLFPSSLCVSHVHWETLRCPQHTCIHPPSSRLMSDPICLSLLCMFLLFWLNNLDWTS